MTGTYREVCATCRRPVVVCYCAHVAPIETRTRVLFLQHPREHDVPINTARIARLCLPNSEIRVGIDFANDAVVNAAIADTERPAVLLFPSADAKDIRTEPPAHDVTLVVVDGTWWQAEKLLKSNPQIRALPCYSLAPSQASRYRIRREPAEHCVATIEALAEVLGVLEGDEEKLAKLLVPFDAMVESQLAYARSGGARTRHVLHKNVRRGPPVPKAFRDRPNDVIVACGETNAWSFVTRTTRPELLHWAAVRPATGERFEAFVRPRNPLAPSFEHYAGVPNTTVENGETFGAFRARWEAFAGEAPVVGYWGHHALDALDAEGLVVPTRLDMRDATIRHLKKRAGTVNECAAAMGATVPTPWALGRAGGRLAALTVIAERMLDATRGE